MFIYITEPLILQGWGRKKNLILLIVFARRPNLFIRLLARIPFSLASSNLFSPARQHPLFARPLEPLLTCSPASPFRSPARTSSPSARQIFFYIS